MIKVAFVIGCIDEIGGTEKATINLANLFAKKGYDVNILSIFSKVRKVSKISNINSKIKISYFFPSIPFDKYNSLFYKFLTILNKKKINNKLRTVLPDVVFYTDIKFISYDKASFKRILMVHFSYDFYRSGYLTKRLFNLHHRKIDKIIFLSEKDLEKYRQEFKSLNGEFVHNINTISPEIRTNYNNHVVVYVGRIDNHQKQLDQAIFIIERLVRENAFKNWKLYIYGDGQDKDNVNKLIKEKDLSDFVEMKGITTNIIATLSQSDIMILTSGYEGLPMCLIEAASCGLPLISYDSSPGIYDIIKNNYNGFIIKKDDIIQFENKLAKLIDNVEMRKAFGKNGIKIIEENFSEKSITKKWEKIINSLIEHN